VIVNIRNQLLLWCCIVCLLFAQGCDSKNLLPSTTPQTKVAIANPAAEKCVQDGYAQELLFSPEGMPIKALCVNKEAKQKCDEWAYFRGDCKLDTTTHIVPLSTKPEKATIANPATVKCLQDGYAWEPIMSSIGVPSGGVCMDKNTKSKCEEWSYFHGECYFDKTFKPVVVSPPKNKSANPTK